MGLWGSAISTKPMGPSESMGGFKPWALRVPRESYKGGWAATSYWGWWRAYSAGSNRRQTNTNDGRYWSYLHMCKSKLCLSPFHLPMSGKCIKTVRFSGDKQIIPMTAPVQLSTKNGTARLLILVSSQTQMNWLRWYALCKLKMKTWCLPQDIYTDSSGASRQMYMAPEKVNVYKWHNQNSYLNFKAVGKAQIPKGQETKLCLSLYNVLWGAKSTYSSHKSATRGKVFFIVIDLCSAFFRIPLADESNMLHKTFLRTKIQSPHFFRVLASLESSQMRIII